MHCRRHKPRTSYEKERTKQVKHCITDFRTAENKMNLFIIVSSSYVYGSIDGAICLDQFPNNTIFPSIIASRLTKVMSALGSRTNRFHNRCSTEQGNWFQKPEFPCWQYMWSGIKTVWKLVHSLSLIIHADRSIFLFLDFLAKCV